jgi:hypothetical protein
MLGDNVAAALKLAGITPARVSAFLGKPCHCEEHQQRLNMLDLWARRVIIGKVERAEEFLRKIVG